MTAERPVDRESFLRGIEAAASVADEFAKRGTHEATRVVARGLAGAIRELGERLKSRGPMAMTPTPDSVEEAERKVAEAWDAYIDAWWKEAKRGDLEHAIESRYAARLVAALRARVERLGSMSGVAGQETLMLADLIAKGDLP